MTTAYTDTGEVGSIGSGLIDAIVSPCFRDETGPINAFNPFNPVAIKKARSAPRANCQVGSRCKIKGGRGDFIGGKKSQHFSIRGLWCENVLNLFMNCSTDHHKAVLQCNTHQMAEFHGRQVIQMTTPTNKLV